MLTVLLIIIVIVETWFIIVEEIRKRRRKYDGIIRVIDRPDKTTYSIEVHQEPEDLVKVKELYLKVFATPAE